MQIDEIMNTLTNQQKVKLVSGVDNWYTAKFSDPQVPEIMMADGPAGLRKQSRDTDYQSVNQSQSATSFPAAAMVAATFNRELAHQLGVALGKAAHDNDVNMVLGPGVNIKRSPLGGRNFEYYSEDPLLAGQLGCAYVKGVQSQGIGATVKHFVANNRENQRMTNSSDIGSRTLHEIYLKPFEHIIKHAHPAGVMASYNKLNGTQVVENKALLSTLLRDEWGYAGVVMSDWYAVVDPAKSLKAGIDLEMPGNSASSHQKVLQAVESGDITQSELDQAVRHVLRMVEQLTITNHTPRTSERENHQTVLDIAREGVVLLKNDKNTLPLKSADSVLVVGPFAKEPRYQGGGSFHVTSTHVTSMLEAFQMSDFAVDYLPGFSENTVEVDRTKEQAVLDVLPHYDHVILALGYRDEDESEGFDKTDIDLPDNQVHLLQAIAKQQLESKLTIVLSNGSVVDVSWADQVSAIVEGYLGGEAGGQALVDVLTGVVNPSGKLAETFPKRLADTPMYETFDRDLNHEVYHEGIFVGYRYYDTRKMAVAYPFGHGLSYTQFSYRNLVVEEDVTKKRLVVKVDVKNIGSRAGKEVIQLYIGNRTSDVPMPTHELRGFEKIALAIGEERTVTFVLSSHDFSWFNPDKNVWQADNGLYEIEVGASARDIRLTQSIEMNMLTPKHIHFSRETSIADIIALPKAFQLFKDYFGRVMGGFTQTISADEKTANAEQKTMLKMATNFPLKGLVALGVPDDLVDQFIQAANTAFEA